jgi:hypothetical protein
MELGSIIGQCRSELLWKNNDVIADGKGRKKTENKILDKAFNLGQKFTYFVNHGSWAFTLFYIWYHTCECSYPSYSQKLILIHKSAEFTD